MLLVKHILFVLNLVFAALLISVAPGTAILCLGCALVCLIGIHLTEAEQEPEDKQ